MVQLELKIVFISLRPETDFLYGNLAGIRLHLLGFLLLLVEILLAVDNLAHGRIRLVRNQHQVEFHFLSHLQCLRSGINTLFRDIVTDQTYARHAYVFIRFRTFFLSRRTGTAGHIAAVLRLTGSTLRGTCAIIRSERRRPYVRAFFVRGSDIKSSYALG